MQKHKTRTIEKLEKLIEEINQLPIKFQKAKFYIDDFTTRDLLDLKKVRDIDILHSAEDSIGIMRVNDRADIIIRANL